MADLLSRLAERGCRTGTVAHQIAGVKEASGSPGAVAHTAIFWSGPVEREGRTGVVAHQTAGVKVPSRSPAAVATTAVPECKLAAIAEVSPNDNIHGDRVVVDDYTAITAVQRIASTHNSSSPMLTYTSRFFK
jgi:hypothetical protein